MDIRSEFSGVEKLPNLKSVLPHRKKVSTYLNNCVKAGIDQFQDFVVRHVRAFGGAITYDFVSKKYKYAGAKIHFFTKDWLDLLELSELKNFRTLLSFPIDFHVFNEIDETGNSIRQDLLNFLYSFGFTYDDIIKHITFVTDEVK